MAKRQTFTKDDLDQYFDRMCLPRSRRVYDVSALEDAEKLEYLNLLQKHHLVKVPWENIVQHYSWHRTVHLRPSRLFQKIVHDPGRGGYCMENNFFFHLILYSLGFQLHMSGSRIYSSALGRYGGLAHVINIVTIAGTKYLLDSGFGGQGPTRPIPMDHGVVSTQIAPAQMRLFYGPIPNNLDQSQKVWIYQHRYNEKSPWNPMYCFLDIEFTPEDVDSMNFAPWLNQGSFFFHKVVCVRFATDREINSTKGPGSPNEKALEGSINASITINHDTLKWRRNGEKIVNVAFKTDGERVAALQEYFGISLSDEDRDAIANTASMIGVKAMGNDD